MKPPLFYWKKYLILITICLSIAVILLYYIEQYRLSMPTLDIVFNCTSIDWLDSPIKPTPKWIKIFLLYCTFMAPVECSGLIAVYREKLKHVNVYLLLCLSRNLFLTALLSYVIYEDEHFKYGLLTATFFGSIFWSNLVLLYWSDLRWITQHS